MKIINILIISIGFCFLLQGCATLDHKLYAVNSAEKSTLLIEAPSTADMAMNIYAKDTHASTAQKIWDSGMQLVYGQELGTKQLNKQVQINANEPFIFTVSITEGNTYCDVDAYFIPQPNQVYRLKADTRAPTGNQTMLDAVIHGVDYGKCYAAIAKVGNNGLIPIKLKKPSEPLTR